MNKLITSAILCFSSVFISNAQIWEKYDMTTILVMPNNNPIAIAEDQAGNIWYSVWGDGIIKLDPITDNAIIFNDINSDLNNSFIRCIAVDPTTGFVWAGTDQGVSFYNGTVWNNFTITNGLAGPQVMDLIIEPNGTKWLVCNDPNDVNKGVTKISPDNLTFTNYTTTSTPALLTDEISLIKRDPATGFIWFGTVEEGILILNPTANTFTQIYSGNSSLNGDEITTLVFAPTGEKFAGVRNPVALSYNGLDKISSDNSTIVNYNVANTSGGLFKDKVSSLAFDLAGNLWIATDTGATVYDYANNSWLTIYRTADDFPVLNTEVIAKVFVDSDGRKWFTTGNSGLIRLGCESGNTNIDVFTTTKNDVSCFGLNDGAVSVGANNGVHPYKYRWSNGAPNGNSVTNLAPGPITVNVSDANGCTGSLTVTITEPAEVVSNATKNGTTLTADDAGTGATYTWINCATNASVGTGKVFEATQNGQFAVVATISGCSDTSACLTVTGIGIEEANAAIFSIYPNPASDYLTIDVTKKSIDFISIVDIAGKVVYQSNNITGKHIIPVQQFNNGVYIIKTQTGEKTSFQKFVKK